MRRVTCQLMAPFPCFARQPRLTRLDRLRPLTTAIRRTPLDLTQTQPTHLDRLVCRRRGHQILHRVELQARDGVAVLELLHHALAGHVKDLRAYNACNVASSWLCAVRGCSVAARWLGHVKDLRPANDVASSRVLCRDAAWPCAGWPTKGLRQCGRSSGGGSGACRASSAGVGACACTHTHTQGNRTPTPTPMHTTHKRPCTQAHDAP